MPGSHVFQSLPTAFGASKTKVSLQRAGTITVGGRPEDEQGGVAGGHSVPSHIQMGPNKHPGKRLGVDATSHRTDNNTVIALIL